MPFTGKATYSAGADLPELAEDVSDIIGLVSPHETPLLDRLGDPPRGGAVSTVHEWIEDTLLPNTDSISDATIGNPLTDNTLSVANGGRFRVGDQVLVDGSQEVLFVTAVAGDQLTVVRGYGGTPATPIVDGAPLTIIGNAALEGDDAPAARFTSRVRKRNYTQIFTASVEVSGSQLAARPIGVQDEFDYQKQERLRELVRDLESSVINGVPPTAEQQGSASTRRTMRGILATLTTNVFVSGQDGFPDGQDVGGAPHHLDEEQLNTALRAIWRQSSGRVDTIVVGGFQKRRINTFLAAARRYGPDSTRYRELVSEYESDFGVCRIVLCRAMPEDAVLLLDSSRVDVLPMVGRSFHFRRLAATGDRESGQLVGEYTVEVRNENAHGVIRGLATA